jgi:putative intracellular protease/amidase
MRNPLPRKVLIAVTSHSAPFYADGTPNGLFYTEVLHPYNVLVQAGFDVDLASETGAYTLDPGSVGTQFMSEEDTAVYRNPEHPLNKKLASLKKASDVSAEDYGMFFASAGFASVYDYPSARSLQAIAENIWARGGVVSTVCHGGAILLGVKDATTGKSIISGQKVTGFSTEGERLAGVLDRIEADGVLTIEKNAAEAGATYVAPASPFDDFTISSGRIVTGANPFSAYSTAYGAVAAFDKPH